MNSNKTLAFISTHIINRAVISEYLKLSKSNDCDCILAIDNTSEQLPAEKAVTVKEFYGEKVNCFLFDRNTHDSLNLPWFTQNRRTEKFSEIMWFNSDYRFYYVRKYFPGYNYYWQFEYDIFCNGNSYQAFFDSYSGKTEDLLIINFRKEQLNGNWPWSKKIGWKYTGQPIYGSLFPVVRLTGTAVDFLYVQRLKQKELYQSITDSKNCNWPFCELFVPTELVNNGFTAFNMKEDQITWDREYDLTETRLFEHPDNLLYHPVKGQFLEREKKLKKEVIKLQKENRLLATQLAKKEKEVRVLKNSKSYKLGRFITFPVREVRNLLIPRK